MSSIEIPGPLGEKVVDVEIQQGRQSLISPPWTLKAGENEIDLEWECSLSIIESIPITFTLRVRYLAEGQPLVGLKRALTTKLKVKSFSSRMLGKLQPMPITSSINHSSSFSSFATPAFKSTPSQSRTQSVATGFFVVNKIQEWVARCNEKVHEFTLDFRAEGVHDKSLGRMTMDAILLRPSPNIPLVYI